MILEDQRLEDLVPSPHLLVLLLDRLHPSPGAVQFLDALLHILDVSLAAVTERALRSPVLGRSARVGDIARTGGEMGIDRSRV